jgi:hypothetical protein
MYVLRHNYENHDDIQQVFADKAVAQNFADLTNREYSHPVYSVGEIELVDGPELHYVAFKGSIFYGEGRQEYYATKAAETILRGELPDIVWAPLDENGKASCTFYARTAEEFEVKAADIRKMLNGLPA